MAIISENKKLQWFKGHEIDNSTSINADIIKVIDIVGCEGWELVGSIQAIPICCHMNLYSPTLTPNFDLPWPLRPLFDLLDNFFQLQNMQLNRFINGTPWYMAKTCATGFQNLGCYAAKTTFYFIEEPIVLIDWVASFHGCHISWRQSHVFIVFLLFSLCCCRIDMAYTTRPNMWK